MVTSGARQNIGSIFNKVSKRGVKSFFNLLQAIRRSLLDAVSKDDEFVCGSDQVNTLSRHCGCARRAVPAGESMIVMRDPTVAGRRICDAEGQTRLPSGIDCAWLIAVAAKVNAGHGKALPGEPGSASFTRSHRASAVLAATLRMRLTICCGSRCS